MKRRVLILAALLGVAAFGFQAAKQAKQFGPGYHPVTGRKIAGVMGFAGADWLVRPEREAEENPNAAIEALGLKPGMKVADLGVGVGYMALRMAPKVGPSGRVFGVDLQQPMLDSFLANAKRSGITNVEAILGEPADPKLPEGQIDLILMVDVYHEVSEPQQMVRNIRRALKSDGRLVLLEYRAEDPSIPINPEHKMTVAQVRAEIEPEGFRLLPPIETLPRQHLLVLVKK